MQGRGPCDCRFESYWGHMQLSTPIEQIPRVGPQIQKKLRRLGIKTVKDLIFHFPHRYEDFSNIIPISEIQQNQTVSTKGKILDIKNIRTFRKRMTLTQALIGDETGQIQAMWFNQPYLINTFKKGDFLFLSGKTNQKGTKKYLSSPAYEKITDMNFNHSDLTHTGRLIPVYPGTEGLSSRWLRFLIKPVLLKMRNEIKDALPKELKNKYKLPDFKTAIWQIHFPDSLKTAEIAKKRFVFEELIILSLFILNERLKMRKEKAVAIPIDLELVQEFAKNLPFKLTDDQRKSSWQILKDLEKPRPMNRLLEGDVGSGKTVVSAMAALNVAKADYQTVFMAPTEILAKQHYHTFNTLLKKYRLKIGLITGKENKLQNKKVKRKDILEKASKGKIDILIGTHALIQKEVKFGNLALVIIDEQHRFGIEQRAKLCQNQQNKTIPHLLSMTATPIPRTLTLTIYGDLDLSLIKELPKGRKKIITQIISPLARKKAYDFIREQIKKGRQVFVICPRIEPTKSENGKATNWDEVKAVKEEYEKLKKEIFPEFKIAMLHGKMKNEEKEKIMKKLKEGKTDILVSTSVIEVGIDIPNATVMAIEGADKFGLAQLHQFRGRVGRGKEQSFCLLLTDFQSQTVNKRLRALIKCENGFDLAEKDLAIRGPGDLSGQRQWGVPDMTMAALKDIEMVEEARNEAKMILQNDPEMKKNPLLRDKLEEFQRRIHLE